jgi:eukaryotic-like serine/threonine-protein kinase
MGQGIIDSRYEVAEVLGQGGCAVVHRAFDRWHSREVALKVLPEGESNDVAVARLAREARAVLSINHPNVCRTFDHGRLDDGRPFVAMELLHGETLRQYVARRGRLAPEMAIEIGVQVLAALEVAHERGIVHRDVKPENVFIVWEGKRPLVKLMDFGICRSAIDPVDDQPLTCVGYVIGTPGYLAPEQVYGDPVDHRADLFAVGLVLFEMLTGRPAFFGETPLELAYALASRVPFLRTLVEVPRLLDRIVAHATEPEPSSRYANAALFQHDLLETRTWIRREAARTAAERESGALTVVYANRARQLAPDRKQVA